MPAHGGLVRGGMLPDASLRECGCYPQGIMFVCLDVCWLRVWWACESTCFRVSFRCACECCCHACCLSAQWRCSRVCLCACMCACVCVSVCLCLCVCLCLSMIWLRSVAVSQNPARSHGQPTWGSGMPKTRIATERQHMQRCAVVASGVCPCGGEATTGG